MSTALYRRYRPETFAEVIGQEHVTEPLLTALAHNRINHAYLFSGPRGCGKTTSARILARCLNCAQGPTATPCGVCDSCRELSREGGGSLDVIEMDAASHGGVDHARDLRERATLAPVRDRYKIFIIDEAHMVTREGFNALLKIVEEPPSHIKFIFATTEPNKVLGTIRSRTHHYPFRLVPPEVLLPYLERLCADEAVPVEPGVLQLVVRAGGGSVRDSLSILDQLIAGALEGGISYDRAVALLGYTHAQLLDEVVDAFAAAHAPTLFGAVARVVATGQDPRRFVEDLLERMRDLVVVKAVPDQAGQILPGVPADQIKRLVKQSQLLSAQALTVAAQTVNAALNSMSGATNPQLQLELLCGRLLVPVDADTAGFGARLEALERRVTAGFGAAGFDLEGAAGSVARARGERIQKQPGRGRHPLNEPEQGARAGGERAQAQNAQDDSRGTSEVERTQPVHTGPVFAAPAGKSTADQPVAAQQKQPAQEPAPEQPQQPTQPQNSAQPQAPSQPDHPRSTPPDALKTARGSWREIVGRMGDSSTTDALLRLEPVRYENGELFVRADMATLRAVKDSVPELNRHVNDFLGVPVRVRAQVAKPHPVASAPGEQQPVPVSPPSSSHPKPSRPEPQVEQYPAQDSQPRDSYSQGSDEQVSIAQGPRGGEDAWRRHGQPVQMPGASSQQNQATSVENPVTAWQVARIPNGDDNHQGHAEPADNGTGGDTTPALQEPGQPFGERDSFASSTPVHTEQADRFDHAAQDREEEAKAEALATAATAANWAAPVEEGWAPVGAENLHGGVSEQPPVPQDDAQHTPNTAGAANTGKPATASGTTCTPKKAGSTPSEPKKSVFAAAYGDEESFETSADDEKIESSVHVGLSAVEKILGGKLVEEKPL